MARRRQRKGASTARRSECEVSSLPALSLLNDVPTVGELIADDEQKAAFRASVQRLVGEGVPEEELHLACVVRLDRGYPALAHEGGIVRAEFSAQLTKGPSARVAVGDWVCLRLPDGHDMGLIQEICPRRSDLARWKGGSRGEKQTLAANVDIVLVVAALGEGGVSLGRLARSVVIARDCQAEAAVVLTKTDRVTPDDLARELQAISATLTGVRVAVTCAHEDGLEEAPAYRAVAEEAGALWGEAGLHALVPHGTVAIMLGESGAGKSTLLNCLLGHEALETGAVRERDDQGRHTTVTRRMVSLADGGVVVDAPGLRSLAIVGHERGLALVFPDLARAASSCRFRDCTHTHEPGCAIDQLVRAHEVEQVRADAYVALAREMRESATSLDPDIVI